MAPGQFTRTTAAAIPATTAALLGPKEAPVALVQGFDEVFGTDEDAVDGSDRPVVQAEEGRYPRIEKNWYIRRRWRDLNNAGAGLRRDEVELRGAVRPDDDRRAAKGVELLWHRWQAPVVVVHETRPDPVRKRPDDPLHLVRVLEGAEKVPSHQEHCALLVTGLGRPHGEPPRAADWV